MTLPKLDETARRAFVYVRRQLAEHDACIKDLTARLARLEATVEGFKATKGKRKTQMPSVEEFIAKHLDFIVWVDEKYPELFARKPSILLEFHDYHRARGTTMMDWGAAARTWFRNASRFEKEARGSFADREEGNRLSKMAAWAEQSGNGELDL